MALIFIHHPGTIDNLFNEVITLLGLEKLIKKNVSAIYKPEYYLGVRRNKDCAAEDVRIEKYNYHDFRYYIDFSPSDDFEEEKIVAIISKLLEYFWSHDIPAYAESEYDDLLPNNGGHSPNVPWPN